MTAEPVARQTLTIRTPLDAVEIVPKILGFEPEHSFVMLAVGNGLSGARLDLPSNPKCNQDAFEALIQPCRIHSIKQVLLITYDAGSSDFLMDANAAFMGAGVQVVANLEVTSAGFRLLGDSDWTPLNRSGHGRNSLADRFKGVDVIHHIPRANIDDRAWMQEVCSTRPELSDTDLARFVGNLQLGDLRDVVTMHESIDTMQDYLVHICSRVGLAGRNHLLAVTALSAYASGNGALAWTALEQPGQHTPLAMIITACLETAMEPSHFLAEFRASA